MNVDLPPEIEDREPVIQRLIEFLRRCAPGKRQTITVEPFKAERSSSQNKALFGHAYKTLQEETGADKDDLHRDFCIKFFGLKVQDVLGFEHRRPIRTTTHDEDGKRDVISVEEFSKFYSMVERLADEFGIWIPPPNPRWFME